MNETERLSVDAVLLRTFLTVAKMGNLTHASVALGRTQSAISVQIRRLEEALSVPLFQREARGMSLTEHGQMLVPAATQVLLELDRIGDMFSAPLRGRLRIGIPDDYGTFLLEDVLAHFGRRHPDVEVSVRCALSSTFPRAIETGALDLAIYAAEPNEIVDTELMTEPTVWAASVAFKPAPDAVVPLALFDRDCWWRDAAINALKSAGRSYRIAYSSESVAGVKAAVAAGLAVGMLAASTVDNTMVVLGEEDGFPELPHTTLVLLRRPQVNTDIADAMEAAVRVSLTRLGAAVN